MLLLLLTTLTTPPVFALPPRGGAKVGVGVGGGLGVSGLSGKFWLRGDNALQVVVGAWGLGRYPYSDPYFYPYPHAPGVSVDYLFEMPSLARSEPVIVAWNLGLGGAVGAYEPAWLGASGVAGLEFAFQPAPIDLTLEYRPGFIFVPGFGLDLVNFSGHARVHF